MDLEGLDPPTLEETFEVIEDERERLHRQNVSLRVLLRRVRKQNAGLEAAVADLTQQLEEARSANRDTPTNAEVGSIPGPTDPTDKETS